MTKPPIRPALAIALLGIVVHVHALANGFAYDDVTLILGDARVHSLGGALAFLTGGYWLDPDLGLYRPLTSISFAVNFALGGSNPIGYHAGNVVLHGAASALVLLLLARLLPLGAALAGAAVFAVHPVHVEAVANVAGRGEVLAAVFLLAACVLWAWRADDTTKRAQLVALPLLFLAGLLAKESVAVLPALLLLIDLAAGRLSRAGVRSYVRRNAPTAALLMLALAVYALLRANALPTLAPTRLDPALAVAAAGSERFMTALQAWPQFARLLFLPRTLLADYGPGVIVPAARMTPAVAAGALLLAGTVTGAAWLLYRRRFIAAAAPLWFLVAIAPVSSLILPIGVLVAERTLYVPSVALALAVAAGYAAAAQFDARRARAATVAVACVALVFAVRSAVRVPEWRSTETIFAAQLRDRPDSFRAQWMEAKRLRTGQQPDAAVAAYARALDIWPYAPQLGLEAVSYAVEVNHLESAQRMATDIIAVRPRAIDIHRILAGIALDRADPAAARESITRGLAIDPDDELLLRMLAFLNETARP